MYFSLLFLGTVSLWTFAIMDLINLTNGLVLNSVFFIFCLGTVSLWTFAIRDQINVSNVVLNYVLFIILSCYFLPVLISTLIDPTNVSNGLVLNYVFFITLSWHCLSVNQGWEFALWFFERIACFLSAREQNSNSLIFLSKSLFCSFLKSYSIWANRSRLLFCEEQREPIAQRANERRPVGAICSWAWT